jgi:hypothetical protein
MIITVDVKLRKQSIRDLIDSGMDPSVASTSFVNLFTILPVGVDSKNLRLPLRTFLRSFSCKSLEAFTYIATNDNEDAQETIALFIFFSKF